MSVVRLMVNGIEIGALPEEQFNEIMDKVKKDKTVWRKQILNILWVAIDQIGSAILNTLNVSLIIFVAAFLFDPVIYVKFFQDMSQRPVSELVELCEIVRSLWFKLSIITLAVYPIIRVMAGEKAVRGYKNYFALTFSKRVREIMEVPAEGIVEAYALPKAFPFLIYVPLEVDKGNEQSK